MRKLPFLAIILLFIATLFSACSKRDNRLFRWSSLSPQADSMVQMIERGYIDLLPIDSLLRLIDELEYKTDILRTNPEFPYFYRATLYHKLGLHDSAAILISKADALCDSSRHPYEKHRINIFKSNTKTQKHKQYLRNFEYLEHAQKYAIQTKDTFLLGLTSNNLGVVYSDLDDTLQCRESVEKAVECYEALNLKRYAKSTELNLLPTIYLRGDKQLFKTKIYAMRVDDSIMKDSVFRVNLMLDVASFLREDWAIDSLYSITTRPHGLIPFHEAMILALKADQAIDKGQIDQAYKYSLRSIEIADGSNDIDLMAKLYPHHAFFCFKSGMVDSAYIYHQAAHIMQDSLVKADARTKVLRATERYEIEKSILTKKNMETRRLLIICLIVSTVVILILCFTIWLAVRNGRLKLEAERAKIDTERNRQLVGQTMLRLHEKNQSIINLSNHIEENISHTSDPQGLRKDKRILALNEKGDKSLETTSKLIDEVSSNLMVNLRKRVPNISKSMLQLAVLIACDIPNKEIAEMLGVQPESIRKQRYRLRALLNLSRDEKLEDVLSAMC